MVQKFLKKTLIIFIIITLSFVLIHFARILLGLLFFCEIDYKIDAIDYIGLVVSTVVTLWIGWYVTKRLTEQRFEKDFLINDLKSMEKLVHDIENVFDSSTSVDISYISSQIDSLQLIKSRLESTLELMRISDIETTKINNLIIDFFSLTTDYETQYILVKEVDIPSIKQKANILINEIRNLIIQINMK